MTTLRPVIDFIVEQKMELAQYPTLVTKLQEKFVIKDRDGNDAIEDLVNSVIFWEKHTEIYESLEKFLDQRFIAMKKQ